MISKSVLQDSIIRECRITKRLYTKLPDGSWDFRPAPGQRTMLELLRYLSYQTAGFAHLLYEGHWDWWKAQKESSETLQAAKFPEAMDGQIQELHAVFSRITDDEFDCKLVAGVPWPNPKALGVELMEHCLGFAVAYRMQLFLYAKVAGAKDLNTWDCWFATDDSEPWPKPKKSI